MRPIDVIPEGPDLSCLTSVQPLETTTQILRTSDLEGTPRDRWWAARKETVRVLTAAQDESLRRRAGRIAQCCRDPVIRITDDGLPQLSMGFCRDRLCPRCSCTKAHEQARKLTGLMKTMNAARFATFTLQSKDRPLAAQLDALATAWQRLRKDPLWSTHCKGGIYAIEVTRNGKTGRWHPHLHVIFDGDFVQQKQLSEAWKLASGGSMIVDIRAVHDRATTAKYLAKYVAKPAETHVWPDKALREYAVAMHGRRLHHTFGSLHGLTTEPENERPAARRGRFGCHVATLLERAAAGNVAAQHAVEIASRLGPLWCSALGVKRHAAQANAEPVAEWELALVTAAVVQIANETYQPPPTTTTEGVQDCTHNAAAVETLPLW